MEPQLSIIIVNWNGEKFLPDCLRSIAENPPSVPYEVIVADNDSSDGSQEWLASEDAKNIFPNGVFQYIQTGENLGFGKANNLVIEKTKTPFVFLLNPDTIVSENAIDKLINTLQHDKEIALAVPKIVNQDRIVQPSVWAIPTATKLIVDGLGLYHLLPRSLRGNWLLFKHWSYDFSRDVPLASGCAMMVSREMIKTVGTFNPDIFMYGEDMEWCYRIGLAGWKLRFNHEAVIVHIGGLSSKTRWSMIESRLKEEESWVEFQKLCLTQFAVGANCTARILSILPRLLLRKVSKKETSFLVQLLQLQYNGLKSALRIRTANQ